MVITVVGYALFLAENALPSCLPRRRGAARKAAWSAAPVFDRHRHELSGQAGSMKGLENGPGIVMSD
ncbi:MAG: hypothetical protein R2864_14530 [Syntrophotaleaceae bacterium]